MKPRLFYHPRMLAYSFGPDHPFKPERLERAMALLESVAEIDVVDPGRGDPEDPLRVHSPRYVEVIREGNENAMYEFGIGGGDNPYFEGMYDATLAFTAGTCAAARAVVEEGGTGLTLAGGLHHARREMASGFCIFNDPAMAISVLRERYDRVAYIDIDLHHGDGVQWIWYDDPTVLTCSIHQDGRTLYPGTGHVDEVGASHTSVNVPLHPGTTGDVWLWAFEQAILPAVEKFRPEAIVLEMGADPHFQDPLGHLQVSAEKWWEAIAHIRDLGLPLVACGGGGYHMDSVVRMWAGAALVLYGLAIPEFVPEEHRIASPTFRDRAVSEGEAGKDVAERVVTHLHANVLPFISRPS